MKALFHVAPRRPLQNRVALALACALPLCADSATVVSADPALLKANQHGAAIVIDAGVSVVTNCNDSGPGSLREAFANAVSGTEISLQELACSKITLTTGALSDSAAANLVVIRGKPSGLTIDGNHLDRVFLHSGSGFLTLTYLTITNGYSVGTGGCIFSSGNVSLSDVNVNSCTANGAGYTPGLGGGVFAPNGHVNMTRSTVAGNVARSQEGPVAGGGVWAREVHMHYSTVSANSAIGNSANYAKGGGIYASRAAGDQSFLVNLDRSSVSGNSADEGGGIFSSDLYSSKSTIAGNTAQANGGGIFFPGAYEFSHLVLSTISNNTAGYLGGAMLIGDQQSVAFERSTITLNKSTHQSTVVDYHGIENEITASGIYSTGAQLSLSGTIVAGNLNILGVPPGADLAGHCSQAQCSTQVSGANDLISETLLPAPAGTIASNDPHLGPLAQNGGATLTHALLPGSAAIDAGSMVVPSSEMTDQRGCRLFIGARQDIGAFELDTDTVFWNGFELANGPEHC
jgi:hypothetical protein